MMNTFLTIQILEWIHIHHVFLLIGSPCLEGTLKLNVGGSFLEGSGCLGVGGVVCNHDKNWIADFSSYEVGGDALLVELCDILTLFVKMIAWKQLSCLLFVVGRDHTLHAYATNILHIKNALHGNGNTTLVHVLME
jgi:hypothetical protein